MTPDTAKKLKVLLMNQEAFRQFPYTDTTGNLTIGYGRNLISRGISETEASNLLDDDITYFSDKLNQTFTFFDKLDPVRQVVLVDMCFNLGFNGLLQFKNMISAISSKKFMEAAYYMVNSKAYSQDTERYKQLVYMMETGKFDYVT
jgi:lysozyme